MYPERNIAFSLTSPIQNQVRKKSNNSISPESPTRNRISRMIEYVVHIPHGSVHLLKGFESAGGGGVTVGGSTPCGRALSSSSCG